MAQNTVNYANNPTGPELLDNYLAKEQENILSSNSGIQRPSYAATGTFWIDTSVTPWLYKIYDGSDDVTVGLINPSTHNFIATGVDESNFVHKSGDETITGTKTFTADTKVSKTSPKLDFYNTNLTKGTTPSTVQFARTALLDKDGKLIALTQYQCNAEGKDEALLRVYSPNNETSYAQIGVFYPLTGSPYTYAPAPTDTTTTSGTQIATTGWVNSTSNNVVHKSGNETIGGTKTFTEYIKEQRANPEAHFINTTVTTGTSKNYDQTWWLRFADTNGRLMGAVNYRYIKDSKRSYIALRAVKSNASSDTDYADLGVSYPASGNPYASAPASDADGSILITVEEGTANNGWYAKLGNGWMIEQGIVTANNQTLTITLPKAFKSATSYSAVGTCNNAKAAYVTTQASSTFTLDASGGIGGTTIRWVAIGKWK